MGPPSTHILFIFWNSPFLVHNRYSSALNNASVHCRNGLFIVQSSDQTVEYIYYRRSSSPKASETNTGLGKFSRSAQPEDRYRLAAHLRTAPSPTKYKTEGNTQGLTHLGTDFRNRS
jgi:hypothetical protein